MGANDEMGSGHGKAKGGQAHSLQNKTTAGGHSRRILRPAQALTTTASRWPASRRAVQVDGGSAVVLALKKAGSDLPNVPTPPIAFACHCPYPLP